MFYLSSSKAYGFVFHTISFKNPHKYKSHGVKSGEREGPRPRLIRQQCLVTLAVGDKGVALRIIGFVAGTLISQSFGGLTCLESGRLLNIV
jgi:hypothetical protein